MVETPTLAALATDPRLLDAVPSERIATLLRQATALALALAARLPEPVGERPEPIEPPGKWLTAGQVAAQASLTVRQVRSLSRRADWKPFTRRLSARTTRFSDTGVRAWLRNGSEDQRGRV